MIVLETGDLNGFLARPLDILAERSLHWQERGRAITAVQEPDPDRSLCSSRRAAGSADSGLMLDLSCDGESLDIRPRAVAASSQGGRSAAGDVMTAMRLRLTRRGNHIVNVDAHLLVAAAQPDVSLVEERLENDIAIAKIVFSSLYRQIRQEPRCNEITLTSGRPFRVRGLFPDQHFAGRRQKCMADTMEGGGDVSWDIAIVIVSASDAGVPSLAAAALGYRDGSRIVPQRTVHLAADVSATESPKSSRDH